MTPAIAKDPEALIFAIFINKGSMREKNNVTAQKSRNRCLRFLLKNERRFLDRKSMLKLHPILATMSDMITDGCATTLIIPQTNWKSPNSSCERCRATSRTKKNKNALKSVLQISKKKASRKKKFRKNAPSKRFIHFPVISSITSPIRSVLL